MIGLSFSEDTKKLQDRLQCLRYLATHTVEVGLTSSASGRSRTLLAIHEHGSPAMHIPARPVVKPALAQASVRAEMGQAMMNACAAALDGELSGVTAALEESGRAGVDGIHAYIDKGIPPPNSPITLKGGWIRNPVSGKPVKVKGKSGTTPLVDTGQLYNDFDFEIKDKYLVRSSHPLCLRASHLPIALDSHAHRGATVVALAHRTRQASCSMGLANPFYFDFVLQKRSSSSWISLLPLWILNSAAPPSRWSGLLIPAMLWERLRAARRIPPWAAFIPGRLR